MGRRTRILVPRLVALVVVSVLAALAGWSLASVGGDDPEAGLVTAPEERNSTTYHVSGPSTTSSTTATTATAETVDDNASTTAATKAADTSLPEVGETAKSRPVIAWQPSHQDDTGAASWHEYEVCGDIVARTIALLPKEMGVLAWETEMGLTGSNNTGSNPEAFNSEIETANDAGAQYFISVHNDGGAPSGVLGMYFTGDHRSAQISEQFARVISDETGLPYRGIRGHDLYSLDPDRNHGPIRVLLEIGDNVEDREFLLDPKSREEVAEALAHVALSLEVPEE